MVMEQIYMKPEFRILEKKKALKLNFDRLTSFNLKSCQHICGFIHLLKKVRTFHKVMEEKFQILE